MNFVNANARVYVPDGAELSAAPLALNILGPVGGEQALLLVKTDIGPGHAQFPFQLANGHGTAPFSLIVRYQAGLQSSFF